MHTRATQIAALLVTGLLVAAVAFAQGNSGSQSGAQGGQGAMNPPENSGSSPATAPAEPPASGPAAEPPASGPTAAEPTSSPTTGSGSSGSGSSRTGAGQAGSAGAGGGGGGELAAPEKSFMTAAAHGGLAEVELGRLATEKASSPDVKAFGQKMVDDHGKANDLLKKIAAAKGFVLPSGLTAHDKAEKAKLEKLSGSDFDRAYINLMVEDHKKDAAELEREAKRAMAPSDLKSFASATLATVQDHLKMAQDLSGKVGASAGGAASPGHN